MSGNGQANGQVRTRAPRLAGARELMLIEDLAVGDTSYAELADRYGLADAQVVANFVQRPGMKGRIAEAAQGQVDAIAGLWITRKEYRLATYQGEVDRNMDLIADIQQAVADISVSMGTPISPDTDKICRLQSNVFRALAAVAEESGQLPTRSPDEGRGPRLRHVVEGLDGWGDPA